MKLSPHLKALINAPQALPSAIPSPGRSQLNGVLDKITSRGGKYGLDHKAWLTLGTAALVTLNSPESVNGLWEYATKLKGVPGVEAASVMRETGLKCISFSGIPRTINALVALRSHIPDEIKAQLPTEPLRTMTPTRLEPVSQLGRALWDDIYAPHHDKLLSKLGAAHPDLPVHILHSHYSHLLSNPTPTSPGAVEEQQPLPIGRVLTSVVAIACLRAQQGVAPQLTSHVFGLKKALLAEGASKGEVQGEEWLTSDQGVEWVLDSTDKLSEVVAGRTSFAGPVGERAKL